jgi:hypothetical protein
VAAYAGVADACRNAGLVDDPEATNDPYDQCVVSGLPPVTPTEPVGDPTSGGSAPESPASTENPESTEPTTPAG